MLSVVVKSILIKITQNFASKQRKALRGVNPHSVPTFLSKRTSLQHDTLIQKKF